MKSITKRVLSVALCAVMVFALASCDALSNLVKKGFDASGYVQGVLDCTYKGIYDKYMELTDATESESVESYESGLDVEVETFLSYMQIATEDEEILSQIKEFYKNVYAKAKYEVKEAQKAENDSYTVEVVISPINIFTAADADLNAAVEAWNQKYEDGSFDELTEEEAELEYAKGILEVCQSYVDKIDYDEEISLILKITADEDDLYTISDNDFQNIDSKIIQY